MSSNGVNEFLIFQSWRDSSALIRFGADDPAHSTRLWVRVTSVDPEAEEVVFTVEGERPGKITLRLKGAALVYRDSSEPDPETDPALKAKFAATVASVIEVVLATRAVVVFGEMKD